MKVTEDEFKAWWDSGMGRWFRQSLQDRAETTLEGLKDGFLSLALGEPGTWAARQPGIAGEAKFADALLWIARDLKHSDLNNETESE